MAGILGAAHLDNRREDCLAMLRLMMTGFQPRPDTLCAVYASDGLCLGQTSWRKGSGELLALTYPCVVDGEIYNRKELVEMLGFESGADPADGDIVAALYRRHGLNFAARINGVFAIALFDSQNRRL